MAWAKSQQEQRGEVAGENHDQAERRGQFGEQRPGVDQVGDHRNQQQRGDAAQRRRGGTAPDHQRDQRQLAGAISRRPASICAVTRLSTARRVMARSPEGPSLATPPASARTRGIPSLSILPAMQGQRMTDQFALTDDQLAIQEMARRLTADAITPYAAQWDEEHTFPRDTVKMAAELGFASIYVSEESGGIGLGRLDAALIMEAMAYGCPARARSSRSTTWPHG